MRRRLIFAMMLLTMVPLAASAQQSTAAVAGQVRDTSGAVLPGVTVEASSPALIEKVRSVVTDDTGQYKILDLRPGAYAVTFKLSGFNSVKREGLALTSGFTATVNAELKVGDLAETITVSGQTPVVDLQSVTQQTVMARAVLDSIPTGRSYAGYARLTPGMAFRRSPVRSRSGPPLIPSKHDDLAL